MLRPTAEALERLDDFRATGVADLDGTYLERRDGVAYLEIRNDRYLNAEDSLTLPTTEVAVDLALLDPEVEPRRDPRRRRLASPVRRPAGVRRRAST